MQQVPTRDTNSPLPTTTGERRADAKPRTDHAQFWGYDLLAPRQGARYLQWNLGALPLPPVDRTAAGDRFGHIAGGRIQGGTAHVRQGTEDQYHIALPGGHGDAHHEPGLGHSGMDGDY